MKEQIREHSLTHFCMTSLNAGEVSLCESVKVLATAGSHMDYETTIEQHLIDELLPFSSAASQAAETDWQDVEHIALLLGVSSQILLEFLVNIDSGLNLHDFTLEWEDATDEHCSTFLLVSGEPIPAGQKSIKKTFALCRVCANRTDADGVAEILTESSADFSMCAECCAYTEASYYIDVDVEILNIEPCDCDPNRPRHNNGGNYHYTDYKVVK